MLRAEDFQIRNLHDRFPAVSAGDINRFSALARDYPSVARCLLSCAAVFDNYVTHTIEAEGCEVTQESHFQQVGESYRNTSNYLLGVGHVLENTTYEGLTVALQLLFKESYDRFFSAFCRHCRERK